MDDRQSIPQGPQAPADQRGLGVVLPPLLRAPEGVRTVFLVTLATACAPLLAGVVLFGWRAAGVAATCVASCAVIERLYYRVSRVPALLGRSHAFLTGVLLALTLPPFVPWYVPVIAAAFAIVVGKVIFGGVGHFLWQPALVGRLAAAVLFPTIMNPPSWPILAQDKLVIGDLMNVARVEDYRRWRNTPAPPGSDGFRIPPPATTLAGLTKTERPEFSGLAYVRTEIPRAKPAALMKMPPLSEMLYGARPGGIGETSSVIIIVAGLYLIYRNYVKWQLPAAFLLAACCVFAVAPVKLAGPNAGTELVWWPLTAEDIDVGFTYLNYQILSGDMLLAAFFLATESTSRPVATGGQVIFGVGCGLIAAILKLYVDAPIPSYLAVLAMNTFTPAIEAMWRPRVLGQRRFWSRWFRRSSAPRPIPW